MPIPSYLPDTSPEAARRREFARRLRRAIQEKGWTLEDLRRAAVPYARPWSDSPILLTGWLFLSITRWVRGGFSAQDLRRPLAVDQRRQSGSKRFEGVFFRTRTMGRFWAQACAMFAAGLVSGDAWSSDNLPTCLSGKYPSLCNRNLLTPDQQVMADRAERAENLATCLTGKYPSLCRHGILSPSEKAQVEAAERAENSRVCLTGMYPSLCRRNLLTKEQLTLTETAERKHNLETCLDGRYSGLCNRSLLTPEQLRQAAQAEEKSATNLPQGPIKGGVVRSGGCFESTIMSPTPFLGNHDEVFSLSDGTKWIVQYEYQYLYEYYPDVVMCPGSGKLPHQRKKTIGRPNWQVVIFSGIEIIRGP